MPLPTPTTPRILLIGATHGDEPIGVRALDDLARTESGFDRVIGNPPAFARKERGFEGDLNRSAPGNPASPRYAERRAAELLDLARGYDWCVDLHGTTAACGVFVILTRLTVDNLRLAARLDIPRIVYWPAISSSLAGPLSEYFPCGLEIECGPKDMPLVQRRLTDVLRRFVRERQIVWPDAYLRARLMERELYEVVGSVRDPRPDFEDFSPADIGGETLSPLLVGQYDDVACYAMRRRTLQDWWP